VSNDITCTEDDANDLSLGRSASDGEAEPVARARDQGDLATQIEESMRHGNASLLEFLSHRLYSGIDHTIVPVSREKLSEVPGV